MSEFERQRDAESPEDPLDQLLSEAEWPEPEAEAVDRLRRHWRSARTARRQREQHLRIVYWLAASAALVALAVGGWWLWRPVRNGGRAVAPVVPERRPVQMVIDDNADAATDSDAPVSPDSEIDDQDRAVASSTHSRPATSYELLLLRSVERRASTPPAETRPTVESQIHGFLNDPDADAADFAAAPMDHALCEQKLLGLIDDASSGELVRIIQLLEHVGSARCVPRLIELSQSPESRSDAMRALTGLADAETIARLARRETDTGSRRQLLSELLSRQSDVALAGFLDLLADVRTREAALGVLDEQTMPPVERLFGFMRAGDHSRQWAAAVVLGRLDQPEVTERLILLARSNVNRQVALAGLLASRDEEAGRFLTLAVQDQTMVAAVYSAQLQLQLMSQQPSMSQQRWRNLP